MRPFESAASGEPGANDAALKITKLEINNAATRRASNAGERPSGTRLMTWASRSAQTPPSWFAQGAYIIENDGTAPVSSDEVISVLWGSATGISGSSSA